jgi:hypothetical protein
VEDPARTAVSSGPFERLSTFRTIASHQVPVMDEIYQFFARRPIAQRAFLAFTIALFAACAAQVSAHP